LQKSFIKETILLYSAKETYNFKEPLFYRPIILRSLSFIGLYSAKETYNFKEPLFYRALLQKRPVILRSVLIVATP